MSETIIPYDNSIGSGIRLLFNSDVQLWEPDETFQVYGEVDEL